MDRFGAPSDEETAERAVARYRSMTPSERIEALRDLLRDMDVLLDGRVPPRVEDDPPFWRRWQDPNVGRPS